MSLKYIRRTYGVPAKRGMRVMVKAFDGPCEGRITSSRGPHIVVAPDPWPNARLIYHPTDVVYLEGSRP